MNQAPFSSTIIPPIGRPALARAVESVLGQEGACPLEVIVVNDSGRPLASTGWQSDPRISVLETDRQERCRARNTGAAYARGRFLHFLDDDDWLLPGSLKRLQVALADSQSRYVYGATRLTDRQGEYLIDLEQEMSGNVAVQVMCGEWIPLQSSLIDKDFFFELGGFHPWQAGSEDIDLVRRAALMADFCYVPHPVAVVSMGEAGSSTDHARQRERSRLGRELILDREEAFRRMHLGAADPGWRGGIVRIYLTSFLWNTARLRPWTAGKRLIYSLAAAGLSGGQILDGSFWAAIARPYRSVTFQKALGETLQPAG